MFIVGIILIVLPLIIMLSSMIWGASGIFIGGIISFIIFPFTLIVGLLFAIIGGFTTKEKNVDSNNK